MPYTPIYAEITLALKPIYKELNMIGNNLNQIARIFYNWYDIIKIVKHQGVMTMKIDHNIGGLFYLTIDGNHRITKYKEMHKDIVDVILLELPDILPLIKSNFEKAVYLFLFEGSDLARYINNSATQYYHNGIFHI